LLSKKIYFAQQFNLNCTAKQFKLHRDCRAKQMEWQGKTNGMAFQTHSQFERISEFARSEYQHL